MNTSPGDIYSPALAQAILDNVVDAIVTISPDGLVRGFNRAAQEMFGYRPEEIIGRNVSLLMPDAHAHEHDAYIESYLRTGIKQIIGIGRELEGKTRSGRIFPMYLAISEAIVNGQRTFTGIIRDLTKQREAEAEIRNQQERLAHLDRLSTLGEMTAGIAHEINQPLTAISLYAQACTRLLNSDEVDRKRLLSALEKLSAQSLRAGSVIEGIQRLVSGRTPQPGSTDINTLVSAVANLAYADARSNDVELRFQLAPELAPVTCDHVQIQQVVLNLLRNAIDAMGGIGFAHGRVVLLRTLTSEGQRVRIEVDDRGPGVAPDSNSDVFAPFHTTKDSGMGMGLSICRTIIDNHGGEIGYHNKPRHGAIFYFELPSTPSPQPHA